jgi:hypothetical protein
MQKRRVKGKNKNAFEGVWRKSGRGTTKAEESHEKRLIPADGGVAVADTEYQRIHY